MRLKPNFVFSIGICFEVAVNNAIGELIRVMSVCNVWSRKV